MAEPATDAPPLCSSFPELAGELRRLLEGAGHETLAGQIPTLRIVDRCRCGDSFCGTFYTASKPKGAWGPGHKTIALDQATEGMLNVDVLNGIIVSVEVLDRDSVRDQLHALLP